VPRLRSFDKRLLQAGAYLEHRVLEPVPFCWMCDATSGKRAKEHVFPRWLVDHLGAHRERYEPVRLSMQHDGAVASRRNEVPIGSLLAGEVCTSCNNGWMNDIEAAVRPAFTVETRRGRLSEEQCLVLARWFTKTAVALNVSMPFRLLFDGPTRHALATGMPGNVVAGLFRVRETGTTTFSWAQSTVTHVTAPNDIDHGWMRQTVAMAYVGRIRVQRLVGVVVVLPAPLQPDWLDSPIARIWPLSERLPTWGALPMFNHYLDPPIGLLLPAESGTAVLTGSLGAPPFTGDSVHYPVQ
jgi:hypothetical protein